MTHSPGPWHWGSDGRLVVADGKAIVDWDMAPEDPDMRYVITPGKSDRALIEAAPEMLALLRDSVSYSAIPNETARADMAVQWLSRFAALLARIEGP